MTTLLGTLHVALLVVLATTATAVVSSSAATVPPPQDLPGQPGETGIGVWLGGGWYANSQFNEQLEANSIEPIEGGFEYGIVVRHRMSRWVSLGADLMRLEGRTTLDNGVEYAILGSPFVVNGYVHPAAPGGVDYTIFGGVGLLIGGTVRATNPAGSLEGQALGLYAHAGADVEARVGPNLALTLRGLFRGASAKNIDLRDATGDPEALFDVDFNGAAIHFGPRWYFGGKQPATPPEAQSK